MKGKLYVLENGQENDIPDELMDYINSDYEHIPFILYDMRERFYPQNREETLNFFNSLSSDDVLICNTTFNSSDGFTQLELMIQLFAKIKQPITLKIMNWYLCNEFKRFIERSYSCLEPKEFEDDFIKSKAFKEEVNNKFLSILSHHNIYYISRNDILIKDYESIIANCKH